MRVPCTQVDKPVARDEPPRSASTHNIWSGRRLVSGGKSEPRERRGSQHRCRPKLDVGKTRGSGAGIQQFCLYFARCEQPQQPPAHQHVSWGGGVLMSCLMHLAPCHCRSQAGAQARS